MSDVIAGYRDHGGSDKSNQGGFFEEVHGEWTIGKGRYAGFQREGQRRLKVEWKDRWGGVSKAVNGRLGQYGSVKRRRRRRKSGGTLLIGWDRVS